MTDGCECRRNRRCPVCGWRSAGLSHVLTHLTSAYRTQCAVIRRLHRERRRAPAGRATADELASWLLEDKRRDRL